LLYGANDPPPNVTRARRLDGLTDEVFLPVSTRIVVVVNWAEELKSMMTALDETKR
jgi:hypothetical protein